MSEVPAGRVDRSLPRHQPVMVREVLRWLDLREGLVVVDGTVGVGGHGEHILRKIGPAGTLIGLDRDPMMLALAASRLSASNCHLIHSSYARLPDILRDLKIASADRVLLDLGLSSDQLADNSRGFSFESDGPLDLRFDPTQGEPASQYLEHVAQEELEQVLREYGEERFSGPIAAAIASAQTSDPIRAASDLTRVVRSAIPTRFLQDARKHPATRVFQALRIVVNRELEQVETALSSSLPESIAPGGRAVVLTFHSLEDRIVKDAFRNQDRWQNLTSRPVQATAAEQRLNPRCRTAKLRAATRTPP